MILEKQCISGFAEEAKGRRAKVAPIQKSKASAKSAPAKGRCKKRSTVVEKRAIALEADLKEIQDAQTKNVDAAKQFDECATNAAAQLAEPFLRLADFEESGKVATEKLADMEGQVTGSSKTREHALRRFGEALKRLDLLEKDAQVSMSQLGAMVKVRD